MKKTALFFYRIYEWLIAIPILLVLTIVTSIITIVGTAIGKGAFWGYWPAHFWARCVCVLFFIRVKVKGIENIDRKTSYVFVANHQGAFDIFSIYGYLDHDFRWLMKKELEKLFLVGYACKRAGHIFVDDTKVSSIRETISQSEERLRDGMSLVIFPEGSRTWDGHMSDFKRGAFMLAAEFRLPVVPITIDGSFRAMPRTSNKITPGTVTLTIHKPIYPGERGFNTKALMAQCREVIQSALPEDERDRSE